MKTLHISITILILIVFSNHVNATHSAGADLTYTCLGGNNYQITFVFYRDCGGQPPAPLYVSIQNKCSSNPLFNFSATLLPIPGTGQLISQSCDTHICTPGVYNHAIQEWVYQAIVTLVPCNSWTMSYTLCCRNPITTVASNQLNELYIEALLNNLQAPCNSSPNFSNRPFTIICNQQPFCFNHGAIDSDGDSLAYSFYTPQTTSSSTTINYLNPWSAANFLTSSGPITLNPVTGDFCFHPVMNMSTNVGMRVEEWRRINNIPILIGVVNRDMQLVVLQCNNQIPQLSGMDTLNTHKFNPNDTIYFAEVCAGETIDFDMNGFDADTNNPSISGHRDIFHIDWNSGIPQGNFNSYFNGTDSAFAHFNWTPTFADVSASPKCFTATIHDEACPFYGSQTFSYCFIIKGLRANLSFSDTVLCTGESIVLTANADSLASHFIWKWNNQIMNYPTNTKNIQINTTTYEPGSDTIQLIANDASQSKCPAVASTIIHHIYQPQIHNTFSDTSMCKGDQIVLNAGPGNTFQWMKIAPQFQILGNSQTQIIFDQGQYIVKVDGAQNSRCIDSDTFEVDVVEKPDLRNDTCIWSENAPLTLSANVFPDTYYHWSTSDSTQSINIYESGIYTLELFGLKYNSVHCIDSVKVTIIQRDDFLTSAKFFLSENNLLEVPIAGDRTICSHLGLLVYGPQDKNNILDYNWYINQIMISKASTFIYENSEETLSELKLEVNGCSEKVRITTVNCNVVAYNVITPRNVDGLNDYFTFSGIENFPGSEIVIFNRWGEKVFESRNYQNQWNGGGLPDGVYSWILTLNDGKNTSLHGFVTIISEQ